MNNLKFKTLTTTFTIIALLLSTKAWSQTKVDVTTAGTLSTLLDDNVSNAVISGKINGTDLKYLRELIMENNLSTLDLSEAKIVKGGQAYYESYTTSNDVIGKYLFTECTNLKKIVLPQEITTIETNAFSHSGITSVDIPNSVSWIEKDAFAYCSALKKAILGKRVVQMDQGVFWGSPVGSLYMKQIVPPDASAPYLLSSKPIIRVYTQAYDDYKNSQWNSLGTIMKGLESLYPLDPDSTDIINNLAQTYFEDAACTTLKADYTSKTDEQLTTVMTEAGAPSDFIDIALKIKNNSWKSYEQEFRVHSYSAYSDAAYWNGRMKSTGGSYMANPTGIYATGFGKMYVFVDDDIPTDATLYLTGCLGNSLISSATTGTKLKKGVNIVEGTNNALYYIVYTADTKSMTKKLSEWPAIKIHIEGGKVNGYYDLTRHSNRDYVSILRNATHDLFTVKGRESMFNFKTSTYRTVWPSTIEKSICWFDSVAVWEKELMGMCKKVANGQKAGEPYYLTGGESIFPDYYNNPNFAIQGQESDAGYANASPYRTSYNSVDCIRNCLNALNSEQDEWCAGHECGHCNQETINLEGGTEVSNNLFSNVVRFLTGRVTSIGSSLSTVMNENANHIPFCLRPIDSQLRMYYQLYLYYHQAQKNTSFYPELFKALRNDPLKLWANNGDTSTLKFVRKACEVAQEDLTEFFRAWGFFEPCDTIIDDYGMKHLVVGQKEIDNTLETISKYSKKNRSILFVEDRADYVPTNDFFTTAGQHRRGAEKVGQSANLGQYTSFLPEACKPSLYSYLQKDTLYAMEGNGGIGFVMLDSNDNMVYAANKTSFCVPSKVGDFTIWSIDADESLHPTTFTGEGTAVVDVPQAGTLSDILSNSVLEATITGYLNGTDIKYIRQLITENNLTSLDISESRIISGGDNYYQTYRTTLNSIGDFMFNTFSQLVNIQLPANTTKIGDYSFSESGLTSIVIPDKVTKVGRDAFAGCPMLSHVEIGSSVNTMSQGVFYQSPVKDAYVKPLTPPAIAPYLFTSNPVIHVHASALEAYQNSEWAQFGTIVGDLDDLSAIECISINGNMTTKDNDNVTFDLSGQRVNNLQKGSVYVRRNHKYIHK